jgi:hypothetical protein
MIIWMVMLGWSEEKKGSRDCPTCEWEENVGEKRKSKLGPCVPVLIGIVAYCSFVELRDFRDPIQSSRTYCLAPID